MQVDKKNYSTIWFENNKIKIIDQTKLPFKFLIKELNSLESFINAIKKMDLLIKANEKEKAKKYFPNFQSVLMQVAKSGVVNKKTAARKISRLSKKI